MNIDSTLSKLDTNGFAELLRARLDARYSVHTHERAAALDLFADNPSVWHSAVDAFGAFHNALPMRSRSLFRHGVAQALRRAQPGQFPPEGVVDLVLLAGAVQAEAAIEPMVDLITDGGQWQTQIDALEVPILAVLKGMGRSREAYGPAKRLLGQLPNHLVFDAYEVLLGGQPRHWHKDFIELLPRFEAALAEGPPDVTNADEWFGWRMSLLVQQHLALLSLPTLLTGLLSLHVFARTHTDTLHDAHPVARLLVTLFSKSEGPFERCHSQEGHLWLRHKASNNGQRLRWPISDLIRFDTLLDLVIDDEDLPSAPTDNPQVALVVEALQRESQHRRMESSDCAA